MKRSEQAIVYAESKISGKYSQSKRWRNNPYTRDCSSFVWSAYDSTGYQMKNTTSTYEVSDSGFNQLWPQKGVTLGKQLGNINTIIKNGYQPQTGDLIFYATVSTTRANKITHVAIVENKSNIIHARSTTYGIRRDSIQLHGTKIVAITRLKPELNIEMGQNTNIDKGGTPNMPYNAICTGGSVNIRNAPNGKILTVIDRNAPLIAETPVNGWSKITTLIDNEYVNGYMSAKYIKRG